MCLGSGLVPLARFACEPRRDDVGGAAAFSTPVVIPAPRVPEGRSRDKAGTHAP